MTTIERRSTRPVTISTRTAAILFAAALVAAPVLAQRHAQPRSGGGGSGGGGGGGGFSGRSSGPSVSQGSGGHSSGGGHRAPGSGGGAPHRPTGGGRHDGGHGNGHGHGGHGGYYGGGHYGHYYNPYYSFGFGYPYHYNPYYYGYGYYPYSYGYYRPNGYYRPYGYAPYSYGYPGVAYGEGGYAPYAAHRASLGAVAIKVRPRSAEVYVDGRYVGAAGNFDGFPGYLWIGPGAHRIELVQNGYANFAQEVEVSAGQVLELEQKLGPGEAIRPEPPVDQGYSRGTERAPYPEGGSYRSPADRGAVAPPETSGQRQSASDLAELVLDVRPDDASVYLDGRFVGTGRDVSTATDPLVIAPGEHRLQVVHPDFTNTELTVTLGAGEEKRVEVTLRRGTGV